MLLVIFDTTIVIEAQELFGFNSLRTGLLFIPLVLPPLVLGPLFSRGVNCFGARIFATIGLAFLTLPLVLLRIPHASGGGEIAKIIAFLVIYSISILIISSPSIVKASYVVKQFYATNEDFFDE